MSFEDWSKVIEEVGDASRERQNAVIANLKEQFKKSKPEKLADSDLVSLFEKFSSHNSHDPRELKLFQDEAKKLKKEILKRLTSKKG